MQSNRLIILIVVTSISALAMMVVGGIVYRFAVEGDKDEALVNGVFALAGSLIGHLATMLVKTTPTPTEPIPPKT